MELQEMGEILNVYCASVFAVEKDMEDIERGEINSNILCVHITEEELLDSLKSIKVDKSSELNQVYPRTLWEVSFFLEVTKRIVEGRAVGVIYVDFSKAFDKVSYGRLVNK
eukprot:g33226.t1